MDLDGYIYIEMDLDGFRGYSIFRQTDLKNGKLM
jgi:hypothetical protein